jgi:hypothetical protein
MVRGITRQERQAAAICQISTIVSETAYVARVEAVRIAPGHSSTFPPRRNSLEPAAKMGAFHRTCLKRLPAMPTVTSNAPYTHCQMTTQQLLQLGSCQVVYLKASMNDGEMVFMLYGADGARLMAFDTLEEAVEMVDSNGLSLAAVH